MDPDAPVFLTGYGPGGLPNHSSHVPKRPDSALQVGKIGIKEETILPRILLKIFYWLPLLAVRYCDRKAKFEKFFKKFTLSEQILFCSYGPAKIQIVIVLIKYPIILKCSETQELITKYPWTD